MKQESVQRRTPFSPPMQIRIHSDGNLLEYTKFISKTRIKPDMYEYTYVESVTKKGKTITFTAEQLETFLITNKTLQK